MAPNDSPMLDRLAKVLLQQPDPAACSACLDALPAYVAAQQAGDTVRERYPAVAAHLDSCNACSADYARLYEAPLVPDQDVPAAIPVPDFGFLEPNAGAAISPAQLRERRAATILQAELRAMTVLLPHGLQLTLTPALLAAQPRGSAVAMRAGDVEEQPFVDLRLDRPEHMVSQLWVRAYADPDASDRCTIRVTVGLAGRAWPQLAGVRVQLNAATDRQQLLTDVWGDAVFDYLPRTILPALQIVVDAGGAVEPGKVARG